jgi:hypothetical protein
LELGTVCRTAFTAGGGSPGARTRGTTPRHDHDIDEQHQITTGSVTRDARGRNARIRRRDAGFPLLHLEPVANLNVRLFSVTVRTTASRHATRDFGLDLQRHRDLRSDEPGQMGDPLRQERSPAHAGLSECRPPLVPAAASPACSVEYGLYAGGYDQPMEKPKRVRFVRLFA